MHHVTRDMRCRGLDLKQKFPMPIWSGLDADGLVQDWNRENPQSQVGAAYLEQ